MPRSSLRGNSGQASGMSASDRHWQMLYEGKLAERAFAGNVVGDGFEFGLDQRRQANADHTPRSDVLPAAAR